MKPYHNEGFGIAYLWLVIGVFWKMHLPDGDCWENSRHEKVCKETANCKIGRNFCE